MLVPLLKKGDTIGIVSPSNIMTDYKKELLDNTTQVIEKMGLKIRLGEHARSIDKYGVSAGEPKERASDINQMFLDPSIKAIWCAQGGDTANQVLELLDYETITNNPKIFIGLSDNTTLLNGIYKKTGLVTFHGPDAKAGKTSEYFDSEYSHEEFKRRFIKGSKNIGERDTKIIRPGKAKGILLGGNLRCLLKLAGTGYMPDFTGAILLLEDYSSNIKSTLFLLTQMRQMGIFDKISGVVTGQIYGMDTEKQYDGKGNRIYFEEILLDITSDYNFPILKVDAFGHKCPSTFLPIGAMAEMDSGFRLTGSFHKA
ncbi:MAG: LD-carboxypeptidase [Candidatus Woesearchaeota archaeon]